MADNENTPPPLRPCVNCGKPAVARYAWSDNPVQADLVGADGLPASPFRTRAW